MTTFLADAADALTTSPRVEGIAHITPEGDAAGAAQARGAAAGRGPER